VRNSARGFNSSETVWALLISIYIHREVLVFVDQFTTLHFMTTGALPAVRCI
jgi:hypothetical protein